MSVTTVTTVRFSALDTLFFRESRPFDTIGGSELASLFPPPPRTVAGAIRTAIGESLGTDWHAFKQALDSKVEYAIGGVNLSERIGSGDHLGQLSLRGTWLSIKGTRLYPAPLSLLGKGGGRERKFARLQIGRAEHTHLGLVPLPKLPVGYEEFKPLEGCWLTTNGLEKVLAGTLPATGDIQERKDLYAEEPRLGIARDNERRTAKEGFLYQTRHIRPASDLAIEVDVNGLDGITLGRRMVRLGGEGRPAGIEVVERESVFPKKPAPDANTHGLILTLMTAARLGEQTWLPSDFLPVDDGGVRVWRGAIHGVRLTVHCAVIGKALREGGWNLVAHAPRPAQSLIPAGSAWYCTVDNGNLARAIDALHGQQIGEDRELGRGRMACGLWNANESITTREG